MKSENKRAEQIPGTSNNWSKMESICNLCAGEIL